MTPYRDFWGRWLDEDSERDFQRENPVELELDDGEGGLKMDVREMVIREIARDAQKLGRAVVVSFGVDTEMCDALAALPGAHVSDTVFVKDGGEEPYVIRGARLLIGLCELAAQRASRPATSGEIETAGGWHEHMVEYRAGHLRSAK